MIWRKRKTLTVLFCVFLMLFGMVPTVFAATSIQVSEGDLAVVVPEAVEDTITLSQESTVIANPTTTVNPIPTGIGCGDCGGNCGGTCPDKWYYCQCSGTQNVLPEISIVQGSDAGIAAAEMDSAGHLIITGVSNGSTSIILQAQFQGLNYDNTPQDSPRVSPPKSITINVSSAPGKTALATPSNVVLSGSSLSWDAVENAAQYLVKAIDKYDGSIWSAKTVTGTSLDVSTFSPELCGGIYVFTITAMPETGSSVWGNSSEYRTTDTYTLPDLQLDTPTNVQFNEYTYELSWSIVKHCVKYDLYYTSLSAPDADPTFLFNFGTSETTSIKLKDYLSKLPPGSYSISVSAEAPAATDLFDADMNYIGKKPAGYYNSDLSVGVGPVVSTLIINNVKFTADGKTIIVQASNNLDTATFADTANSGVELTVNGEVDPLVRIQTAGTASTGTSVIALTFQNAMKNSDAISLTFHPGSLKDVGGYAFQDVVCNSETMYNFQYYGQLLPGFIQKVSANTSQAYKGDGLFAFDASHTANIESIAFDSNNNLYIADSYTNTRNNYGKVIRKIDAATGVITTVAGNGTTNSGNVTFSSGETLATDAAIIPQHLALDSNNSIYATSMKSGQNYVYKIDAATNIISIVAGTGAAGESGDGGPASSAQLKSPIGIALDSQDNIYIAEQDGYRIRKIDAATGAISTFAGTGDVPSTAAGTTAELNAANGNGGPATEAKMRPNYIEIVNDVLYFVDYNTTDQVRKIDLATTKPTVTVVAGAPKGSTDGVSSLTNGMDAASALLGSTIKGVSADLQGNVYFSQNDSYGIWQVTPDGKLYQIAGGGNVYWYAMELPAASAKFRALDVQYHDGLIYYTDNYATNYGIFVLNPGAIDSEQTSLPAPQNLAINGTILSWDKVANAVTYTITITDQESGDSQTQTAIKTTSFDFSTMTDKLALGTYEISIVANPMTEDVNYTDSPASETVTYNNPDSYLAGHVVISQAYGGGGTDGATYKNDFVELYNPTDQEVDLDDWSLQVCESDTGLSLGSFKLQGTIKAKGYYLLEGASAGDHGANLPAANIVDTSIDIQPMKMRLALLNHPQGLRGISDPALVDLVAVSGSIYEGPASNYVAPKPTSVDQSIMRLDNGGGDPTAANSVGNGWDTNNNKNDFVLASVPNPRNGNQAATAPSAPTGLSATADNTQVTLTWDAVAGATSYNVSWSNEFDSGSETGITGAGGTITYTVTGLGNGQAYDFAVTAVNAAGESEQATISATPSVAVSVPAKPAGLSATAGEGSVTLTWNPVEGSVSYNVYMGTVAGEYDDTPLAAGITGTTYTAADLTNGTTYYFAVTAVNTAGESEKSDVSATPAAAVTVPAAPANLTAIGGDGQATLTWNAAEGAVSYNVYMGPAAGAYGAAPLVAGITGTSYTATGLTNGTTYYFAITAVNSIGESEKSNEASATCREQNDEEDMPQITGYTVSTEHGGDVISQSDDQYINLTVSFDQEVSIKDAQAALDELNIKLNDLPGNTPIVITSTPAYSNGSSSTSYPVYSELALGADGKSLQFKLHFGFAPYAGYLTVQPRDTINQITGADGTTPVKWTNIALYVPNGVQMQTVSQTAGNSATGTAATVTKKVVAPASATRGMIHMLFLKNGLPVGELDSYGSNLTTHYHLYLTLNAESFSAMIPGWFEYTFSDYTITTSGDTVTITENNIGNGDVLDLRIYAYPQDRDTGADKNALNALIEEASNINGSGYTAETYNAMQNELYRASSMAGSIYYLQTEIDAAAEALQTAINLLQQSGSAPAAPADLSATAGEGTATLAWSAASGADSYKVYKGTVAGEYDATPIAAGITGTSYTATGLTNGTTYYFAVTAANSIGESEKSNEASSTPAAAVSVPAAPANLTAIGGDRQIILYWNPAEGSVSYNVYRGTASGEYGAAPLATGITGTSYTAAGLTNGTTYYFAVTAVNSIGESEKSNEASATPAAAVSVPAAPANLTAIGGDRQIILYWNPAEGSVSYNVYRGTASGEYGAAPLATGITGTSYTAAGLTNGTTYYFAVTAVNTAGVSEKSNEASATPAAASNNSGGGGGGSTTTTATAVTVSSDQNGQATITAASLKKASEVKVKVSGVAELVLDADALKAIGVDKNLVVSAVKVDNKTLSADLQEKIGDRPVFDIDITSGGQAVTDLGQGQLQIRIPYELAEGEKAEQITAYYIDAEGKAVEMSGAYYDAAAKAVVFTTTHLSRYAVGYKESLEEPVEEPSKAPVAGFADVPATHWAASYILELASKGIVNGKTATTFAPDDTITRAEFVKILAGVAGADVEGATASVFSDVAADAWYAPYVAWADQAGVAKGADGKFNPDASITRQDMAVMLARFVKDVQGATLPSVVEAASFADSGEIAGYATDAVATMQKAGVINGKSNNQFAPSDHATRAEAAKMLASLMRLMEKYGLFEQQ